jgi:hypothetical protein
MRHENLANLHYSYMDFIRHWHPVSEPYTGGDALFTAVDNGWQMEDTVRLEEHWHSGARRVVVYHFELRRGDEVMHMPVTDNPYISRVISHPDVHVVTETGEAIAKVG